MSTRNRQIDLGARASNQIAELRWRHRFADESEALSFAIEQGLRALALPPAANENGAPNKRNPVTEHRKTLALSPALEAELRAFQMARGLKTQTAAVRLLADAGLRALGIHKHI